MARAGIDVITIGKVKGFLSGFASGTEQHAMLNTIISIMSTMFENYLNRYLYQTSRTEYFDIDHVDNLTFFPRGVPISAVTGYYDESREWGTGTDIDAEDCIISADSMAVQLVDDYIVQRCEKALKLVYTGGLATSTWNITAVLSSVTGTFTAGNALYVSTNVKGTVVSWTAAAGSTGTLVWTPTVTDSALDEMTGGFAVGDSIKETGSTPTGKITSFSPSNLLYDYPEIMAAALAQAAYIFQHKDHPGKTEVSALGERMFIDKASRLCPEAKEYLDPLRIRGV